MTSGHTGTGWTLCIVSHRLSSLQGVLWVLFTATATATAAAAAATTTATWHLTPAAARTTYYVLTYLLMHCVIYTTYLFVCLIPLDYFHMEGVLCYIFFLQNTEAFIYQNFLHAIL